MTISLMLQHIVIKTQLILFFFSSKMLVLKAPKHYQSAPFKLLTNQRNNMKTEPKTAEKRRTWRLYTYKGSSVCFNCC